MKIEILTLPGIPLVEPGDDLTYMIYEALGRAYIAPQNGDIFVVAQKVVSKAEGRLVNLSSVVPGSRAIELAKKVEKDPRLVQLVLSESASIVFTKPGMLLVEHRLGFVMPNAGIDQSNIGAPGHGTALLLPVDPVASAKRMWDRLSWKFGVQLGVIINDSVSRAWRAGTCGVALGTAGLPVLNDIRGTTDLFGRELRFSITGFADEVSSAASLVMGQGSEGTPVVVVRGLGWGDYNSAPAEYGPTPELLVRPSVRSPELVTLL